MYGMEMRWGMGLRRGGGRFECVCFLSVVDIVRSSGTRLDNGGGGLRLV